MSLDTSKLDALFIEIGLHLDRQQGHGGSFEERSKHQDLRLTLRPPWPGPWHVGDCWHPESTFCRVCGEVTPT